MEVVYPKLRYEDIMYPGNQFEPQHKITLGKPMSRFPGDKKRYLTSSRQELEQITRALRKGARKLKLLGHRRNAELVRVVLEREWNQKYPPLTAYVTKTEWAALSLALRSDALTMTGVERDKAMKNPRGELGAAYRLLVRRKEY